MNIFFLSPDPVQCAQYHNDRHVNKMILESAQMLSTAVRLSGVDFPECTYKSTHMKHGCSRWARESLSNWLWLRDLAYALSDEFDWRFDRPEPHKSISVIRQLPLPDIPDKGLTPLYEAMPDVHKLSDPVDSYRRYYNMEKRVYFTRRGVTNVPIRHKWTKRGEPFWWWPEEKASLCRVATYIETERKYGVWKPVSA